MSDAEQQQIAAKKPKMTINEKICAHWLQRKKRYCKMTVAKGRDYCGEHDKSLNSNDESTADDRIPCPLDAKHTIYRRKLKKHLLICNARQRNDEPAYIEKNINAGAEATAAIDAELAQCNKLKLHELEDGEFYGVIEKVKQLYAKYVANTIDEKSEQLQHKSLDTELAKDDYGKEARKHLIQTAALLGILENEQQLCANTSYVEFGAGKGQLAYFMANVLQTEQLSNSQVVLVDRMSLRHKKDNKIVDRTLVQRIRADIADFKMSCLDELKRTERNVALSKHLCGAATDLTLRCVTQSAEDNRTEYIMIAVCCHHRCEWRSYVGKEFLQRVQLTPREFVIITKMVSWAICGSGMSRERRKALEALQTETETSTCPEKQPEDLEQQKQRLSRSEREEIGFMCKRVLDHGRLEYLRQHGYEASLKFYVPNEVTLENVCLLASRKS